MLTSFATFVVLTLFSKSFKSRTLSTRFAWTSFATASHHCLTVILPSATYCCLAGASSPKSALMSSFATPASIGARSSGGGMKSKHCRCPACFGATGSFGCGGRTAEGLGLASTGCCGAFSSGGAAGP
eukprot:5360431-Lingulodinium_polyedra.AAC.2